MAGIADLLIQSGLKSSMEQADVTGAAASGAQMGAQLAQTINNTQKTRADIEAEKQKIQLMKVDKLTSAMEIGAKIPSKSARNAYFKNYIPSMQAALGLQDFVPPETMAMIQADPEQAKKFSLLKTKIMNGAMTYDQAVASMQPEEWAMLDDKEVLQMEAAEKFRVQQQEQNARAPGDRLADQFAKNKMIDFKKQFDTATNKLRERYIAGNTAVNLIELGNPIADEASKGQIARLSGEVGVLTDQDIARFGGSKAINERMQQAITQAYEGKLTKENRALLKTVATRIRSSVETEIRNQEKRVIEGAAEVGIDREKMRNMIGLDYVLGGGAAPSGADPKVADYAKQYNMTYEQALQVLTKRGYQPKGK